MKKAAILVSGLTVFYGLAYSLQNKALGEVRSLNNSSSANYKNVFDGSRDSGNPYAIPDPKPVSAAEMQKAMLADLNSIRNIINANYAPATWKESHLGWNLDQEITNAEAKVKTGGVTVKQYQQLVKGIFQSMRDYHVSVRFAATESASLGFDVLEADGHYYIVWINRDRLPESSFPFHEGDEVVSLGGKDIRAVMQDIQAQSTGNVARTDRDLSAMSLTGRSAAGGFSVPSGQVVVGLKPLGSQRVVNQQLAWNYTPEAVRYDKSRSWESGGGTKESRAIPLPWLDNVSVIFEQEPFTDNPFGVGGKKSFVPVLGEKIWETKDSDIFYAYIYKSPVDGRKIGCVRIPRYSVEDYDAAVGAFAAILTKFNAETDGMVIDQVNNPGGSLFYVYALASMLTDHPLASPRHRIAITQNDVVSSAQFLKSEAYVKTDADAQKVLGKTLSGYPVDYQSYKNFLEFSRFIVGQWNAGKTLTDPTWVYAVDQIEPSSAARYTKPILVLINQLDFSGGDFFPAILQDGKCATFFGERTAGAGGFVKQLNYPNRLGVASFSLTGSIAERTSNRPIENLGVEPEIKYVRTSADLQDGFKGYAAAVNKAIAGLLSR